MAVQWFISCGTSSPSGLAIGRKEIKVVASHSNEWSTPDGGVVPQMVNHCTVFNDRYMMFS